jgi:geranylgeranyl diphosphate synthase type II
MSITSYKDWIENIESELINSFDIKDDYGLIEPMNYILSIGGKRIRPAMVLLTYQMFRDNPEEIVPQAVVVEAFHNFTLMHDDIMDEAPVRRGKTTVHKKWDVSTAILSGDAMLVKCYQMLADAPKESVQQFSQMAMDVCLGQMMDMNFEEREDVEVEEYIEMIRLKTAVLIGYSMELGARLAGARESDVKACRECGINIGLSFQLMDDILDAFGKTEETGKQVGGDILADKKTFLTLLTKEKTAQNTDYSRASQLAGQDKVNAFLSLYNSLGVKEDAEKRMEGYYQESLSDLRKIDAPDERKKPIFDLFNFLSTRNF